MLEVVFHLAAPLTETEPSFTSIQGIDGEIRDDESEVFIGNISASLVQVGRIADAGENLFDVMEQRKIEVAGPEYLRNVIRIVTEPDFGTTRS